MPHLNALKWLLNHHIKHGDAETAREAKSHLGNINVAEAEHESVKAAMVIEHKPEAPEPAQERTGTSTTGTTTVNIPPSK